MNSSTDHNAPDVPEFQKNLELLRQVAFFAGLPLEQQKLVAYLCVRDSIRRGDNLFVQGDMDHRAYLIIEGRLEAYADELATDGPLASFKTGDFLGCLSLLGTRERLFTLQAVEDTTFLVLEQDKFRKALEQYPEITAKIMEAAASTVYFWEDSVLRERSSGECAMRFGVSLL